MMCFFWHSCCHVCFHLAGIRVLCLGLLRLHCQLCCFAHSLFCRFWSLLSLGFQVINGKPLFCWCFLVLASWIALWQQSCQPTPEGLYRPWAGAMAQARLSSTSKHARNKSPSASICMSPLVIAFIREFFPHILAIGSLNLPLLQLSVASSKEAIIWWFWSLLSRKNFVQIWRCNHPGTWETPTSLVPGTIWIHQSIFPALHGSPWAA